MELTDLVTICVVNHKTLRLTRQCVDSIREFYPELPIYLTDNGSGDMSTQYVKYRSGPITPILHPANIGHGPAMDFIFLIVETPMVLTFDSDARFVQRGLLEVMAETILAGVYAVGPLQFVNESGIDVEGGIPYVHPRCAMWDRNDYLSLPPFINHGAPCLANAVEVSKRNMLLRDLNGEPDYFHHEGRGTRDVINKRFVRRPQRSVRGR